MRWEFKANNPYESRRAEGKWSVGKETSLHWIPFFLGERIRREYPDRCAVIVERAPNSRIADLPSKKYLVPNDLTVMRPSFLLFVLFIFDLFRWANSTFSFENESNFDLKTHSSSLSIM